MSSTGINGFRNVRWRETLGTGLCTGYATIQEDMLVGAQENSGAGISTREVCLIADQRLIDGVWNYRLQKVDGGFLAHGRWFLGYEIHDVTHPINAEHGEDRLEQQEQLALASPRRTGLPKTYVHLLRNGPSYMKRELVIAEDFRTHRHDTMLSKIVNMRSVHGMWCYQLEKDPSRWYQETECFSTR